MRLLCTCIIRSYKQSYYCVLSAAVSCGPAPNAPANGQRNISGTTFASTVTYTCNRGYILQGDSRRTCMANREWSGRTPTCNRKLLAVLLLYTSTWASKVHQGKDTVMTVGGSPGVYRHRANKQQVEWQCIYMLSLIAKQLFLFAFVCFCNYVCSQLRHIT